MSFMICDIPQPVSCVKIRVESVLKTHSRIREDGRS